MASRLSREKAAQAWCSPLTSHLVMQPELAEAFAEILDEIWSKPWLGNATTGELIDELRARAEVHGWASYKTTEGEEWANRQDLVRIIPTPAIKEGHTYIGTDRDGFHTCRVTDAIDLPEYNGDDK